MRIIAGARKGTIITAPRGAATRPTADKVRGAVFNMLGDVSGLMVLDLFAGSGALGLEALSRGAAACVLVDNRPAAAKAITANITKLGFDNARLRRRDFRAFLRDAAKKGDRFDLIFIDPPYKMHRVVAPELDRRLPQLVAGGGSVIIESGVRSPVSLAIEPVTRRKYGDTLISRYIFPPDDHRERPDE